MRLLYDLDDTVGHFRRRFLEIGSEHYPRLVNILDLDTRATFDLWEGRTEEEAAAIAAIMDWPNFYRDLEPYEGAVEAVKEAASLGHEVFFVSAPWLSNKTCASDKYAWVEEHFGLDYANKLILARDKTIVAGDILFDDKHPIPNRENATWTQVFVDAPYNRGVTGYRIRDWTTDDWKILLQIIQEEKRQEAQRDEELAMRGYAPW
jgi:5'-nucleotidase